MDQGLWAQAEHKVEPEAGHQVPGESAGLQLIRCLLVVMGSHDLLEMTGISGGRLPTIVLIPFGGGLFGVLPQVNVFRTNLAVSTAFLYMCSEFYGTSVLEVF